jgi:Origin of replication binding protein
MRSPLSAAFPSSHSNSSPPKGFLYLKRDCPVCESARKDCRQSAKGLIHCRSSKDENNGWHLVGTDRQGFGLYSQTIRPDWEPPAKVVPISPAPSASLPIPDIDQAYRRIAQHTGALTHRHRIDLGKRGLTGEQIDRLQQDQTLFGWSPGASIPGLKPVAGLNQYGKLQKFSGYAIALQNPESEIVGIQIKLDEPQRTELERKYTWTSGVATAHVNGEMPLGYCSFSDQKSGIVYLAEGALKPILAAILHNIEVIGSPSAGWAGSPRLFREFLESVGASVIRLLPDAGMLDEPHRNVHAQYRRAVMLLRDWGYAVEVGWWGQSQYSNPDCDELRSQEWDRINWITWETYDEFQIKQCGDDAWLTQKRNLERKKWLERHRYSADTILHQAPFLKVDWVELLGDLNQYINWPQIRLKIDLLAIKSPMGSGKTTNLANLCIATDLGMLMLGTKNSLMLNAAEKLPGFTHLQSDQSFAFLRDPQGRHSLCIESLHHIKPSDCAGKIILLDEGPQIRKHLLFSKTLSPAKRRACEQKLREIFEVCAGVILLSAELDDATVDFVRQLAGDRITTTRKIDNSIPTQKWNIELLGTETAEGKRTINNRTPEVAHILRTLGALKAVASGRRAVAIASDNQNLLERIDELLLDQGYRTFRLDSKSSDDREPFLKNPDEWLGQNRIDVLLYSPSAESGLDISIKDYFYKCFVLYHGVVDIDGILQMAGRIRDCDNYLFTAREYARSDEDGVNSTSARQLQRCIMGYLTEDLKLSGLEEDTTQTLNDQFAAQNDHFWIRHATAQMALWNFEKINLWDNLRTALENQGHAIVLCTPETDPELKDRLKSYGEAIRKHEAHQTFTAPDITLDQAINNLSKFTLSAEDRYAAEKALLKAQLPGIEQTNVWGPDFIECILKDRGKTRRLERLYLLQNLEVAKAKAQKQWTDLAQGEVPFVTDIRSDLALLTALSEMKLLDLVGMVGLTSDSPEIIERHHKGKLTLFKTRLQRSPGKPDHAIAYVGRLMRLVGIQSTCKRVRRFKGDENPDRLYSYSLPDDPFDVAILACIERRYAKFRDASKKSAESIAQKEIELDPPSPSLLKKEGEGGSKSLPIVGEVFQRGDTEYRVVGIREREGVSWLVMQYLGYEYLPVWVRCDRFWDWRREDRERLRDVG